MKCAYEICAKCLAVFALIALAGALVGRAAAETQVPTKVPPLTRTAPGRAAVRAVEKPAPAKALLAEAQKVFAKLPAKMPGSEKDTPAKIALGKKLYFEECISINRKQSCNSCHRLDEKLAGVDNLPTSKGAEGKFGGRNAPTTLNAGLHIAQFWDGRAPDLAAQAKGPVLNPIEMGMPNEKVVLERLKEAGYESQFKSVFPAAAHPVTYDNYAEAVAAFERTLITRDRFDDFLGGDEKALTDKEKRGLSQFMKIGCAECHRGALLGGDRYEKMGEAKPYANTKDLGRFEVTKKDDDKMQFKVPSLRNIALTGPYFHDGKAATLADAVGQMAWLQLGEKLAADQADQIVAFLHALSDKDRAKPAAKPAKVRPARKKPRR
jgi:cytochrome c peroxidase